MRKDELTIRKLTEVPTDRLFCMVRKGEGTHVVVEGDLVRIRGSERDCELYVEAVTELRKRLERVQTEE